MERKTDGSSPTNNAGLTRNSTMNSDDTEDTEEHGYANTGVAEEDDLDNKTVELDSIPRDENTDRESDGDLDEFGDYRDPEGDLDAKSDASNHSMTDTSKTERYDDIDRGDYTDDDTENDGDGDGEMDMGDIDGNIYTSIKTAEELMDIQPVEEIGVPSMQRVNQKINDLGVDDIIGESKRTVEDIGVPSMQRVNQKINDFGVDDIIGESKRTVEELLGSTPPKRYNGIYGNTDDSIAGPGSRQRPAELDIDAIIRKSKRLAENLLSLRSPRSGLAERLGTSISGLLPARNPDVIGLDNIISKSKNAVDGLLSMKAANRGIVDSIGTTISRFIPFGKSADLVLEDIIAKSKTAVDGLLSMKAARRGIATGIGKTISRLIPFGKPSLPVEDGLDGFVSKSKTAVDDLFSMKAARRGMAERIGSIGTSVAKLFPGRKSADFVLDDIVYKSKKVVDELLSMKTAKRGILQGIGATMKDLFVRSNRPQRITTPPDLDIDSLISASKTVIEDLLALKVPKQGAMRLFSPPSISSVAKNTVSGLSSLFSSVNSNIQKMNPMRNLFSKSAKGGPADLDVFINSAVLLVDDLLNLRNEHSKHRSKYGQDGKNGIYKTGMSGVLSSANYFKNMLFGKKSPSRESADKSDGPSSLGLDGYPDEDDQLSRLNKNSYQEPSELNVADVDIFYDDENVIIPERSSKTITNIGFDPEDQDVPLKVVDKRTEPLSVPILLK
jgi:hypothetical protein